MSRLLDAMENDLDAAQDGVPIATEKKTTNLVPSPRISAVRLLKTRLQLLDSRKPIQERLSRIKIPQNLVIAA